MKKRGDFMDIESGCLVKAYDEDIVNGTLTIPEGVDRIGSYACTELKMYDVVIPETVKVIGQGAFENCKNLKEVVMGNNVKSYRERAFKRCESLSEIQNSEKLEFIGNDVFTESGLKTFNMPNNDIELGYRVFSNCKQLESIELSSKLEKIPGHFLYNCIALKSIQIPDSVSMIEERAFAGSGLKELICPSKIEKFDLLAVKGCKNLDRVSFPEGEVYGLQNIFTEEEEYVLKNIFDYKYLSYFWLACDKLCDNENPILNDIEWIYETAAKMADQMQLESYEKTELIRNILKIDKVEKAYASEKSIKFPVKGQENIIVPLNLSVLGFSVEESGE